MTKFWTTSLLCTSMVMMLMIFIRSKTSKGLVTFTMSLVILLLIMDSHYFIAPYIPEDNSSKALLTSSVQIICVVKRAICDG